VQARLDTLCQTFERLKPVLVSSWSARPEQVRGASPEQGRRARSEPDRRAEV
jgi:hypothetical protein